MCYFKDTPSGFQSLTPVTLCLTSCLWIQLCLPRLLMVTLNRIGNKWYTWFGVGRIMTSNLRYLDHGGGALGYALNTKSCAWLTEVKFSCLLCSPLPNRRPSFSHIWLLSLDSWFAVAIPCNWNSFLYPAPSIIQATPVWTPVTEHSLSSNSRAFVAQKGSPGASPSGSEPWPHPSLPWPWH